jgi:DegV family protein with EDD domain
MIRIITDSTCEPPPSTLKHPALTIVPLTVMFGQASYKDGIDISREEFWRRLPKSSVLPTTSQAVPGDFRPYYEQFCAAGDEVVVLTISSKLSGTHNSAVAALEGLTDRPITVIDSETVTVALGLMVAEALRLVDAGATRAEIVARMEQMRGKVWLAFVLETLEYLHKGGRIGKAQAYVGTLLKFKPVLAIHDGEVTPVTRMRSRAKAIEAAQEYVLQHVTARGPQVRLAVTHAQAPDEARELGAKLQRELGAPDFYAAELGPVLGVYVGPAALGVAAWAPD